MRIGIDTYSFHRWLGFLRPGEAPCEDTLTDGSASAVHAARSLGADVVSLQTCFAGDPSQQLVEDLLSASPSPGSIVIAWGAPDGLKYGSTPAVIDDALKWVGIAAALGGDVIRIVLGGPSMRDLEPQAERRSRVVPQVRMLASHAADLGVRVAIENHGEITAEELEEVIVDVGDPEVGVCFDLANAIRVGDDPVTASRRLADRIWMIHFKDVEPLEAVTNPVAGPCSVPYGSGIVPLVSTLEALRPAIDTGTTVFLELGQLAPDADEVGLLQSGFDWLRSWDLENQHG